MTKSKLQEEFKKLTSEARKVGETNNKYRADLLVDIETDMANDE